MTPLQKQRLKEKRQAKKDRLRSAIERRKAKRVLKAIPRDQLANWSMAVRSGGRCMVCGRGGRTDAHHLLPKERYKEFKLEPMNGVALCPGHHKFFKHSAHRNPIWFVAWLKKNRCEQYIWAKKNMGDWQ